MTEILIVILLGILILKEFEVIKVIPKETKKQEETEEEKKKREEIQKQFDVVMNYDIEDAIKSKRGE